MISEKKAFTCFLSLILYSSIYTNLLHCTFIQSDSTNNKAPIIDVLISDVKIGLNDAIGLISLPFELKQRDWIYTGAGATALVIMMTADEEIKRIIKRDQKRIFDGEYQKIPIKYGQIEYGGFFSAGIYSAGLITQWDELRVTGRLLGQSLIYSGSTVMVLRWLFGRTRPFLTDNSWDFKWFVPRFRNQAFPSGHATVAFAISTILSNRINNTFVSIGLYSLAIMDGFLQIYNDQHWLSDIVLGSLIGIGSSLYVLSREETRNNNSWKERSLKLIPTFGGVKLIYEF